MPGLRSFTQILSVFAVLIAVTAVPVSAGENRGLCDAEAGSGRTLNVNNAGVGIEYCFDGRRLHVRNTGDGVVRIEVVGDANGYSRDDSGGSIARTGIAQRDRQILPPGYTASASIGSGEAGFRRTADVEETRNLLLAEGAAAVLGLVPGVSVADALIEFVDEVETVWSNRRDCVFRASNIFSRSACEARFGWDLDVAIKRAAVNGLLPVVGKAKTVFDLLAGFDDVNATVNGLLEQGQLLTPGSILVNAAPGSSGDPEAPGTGQDEGEGRDAGSNPSISLSRGRARGSGFWYAVTLSGFSPGSSVSVTCRDSADPGGFHSETYTLDSNGRASDSTLCYSADGPDHWVTVGGAESNRVSWSATSPQDSVPLDTVPLDSVPLDTVPLDTVPLDTVPLDTVPLDTVPLDTVPPAAPVIASFDAIVRGGGSVQMAGQIGWEGGTDPITCTFFVDGGVVLDQQCGVSPSYTVTVSPGAHSFQLRICNRLDSCTSSAMVNRNV